MLANMIRYSWVGALCVSFACLLSQVAMGQDSAVTVDESPPDAVEQVEDSGVEDSGVEDSGVEDPGVEDPGDWQSKIDAVFGKYLVAPLATVLFADLGTGIPLVVAWLTAGATFFTIRMGLINFRGFWHAIRVTKGDYDDPKDTGEVTHFQALTSALSATVGLGNIAGVAIAVGTGGPGAVFWMVLAGFIGMTSKFVECTLAQMYRQVDADGRISGGPMRYLKDGLAEQGLGALGGVLAVVFAVLCIGGSFGGGCTFQVVQSLGVVQEAVPVLKDYPWIYGLVLSVLVGIVIIGGIKRIAATAEKLVPSMCVIYVVTALAILGMNYDKIGWAFGEIFRGAFSLEAGAGGFLGVMVIGIKRAAFSNEAGVGSAAIAHSAAKTEFPVREGIVACLGPFIDTVVICTMTGLVIVITQAYDTTVFPEHARIIADNEGARLTSNAFGSVISWFPWVLTIAATLFAYSTIISWSYYGERCWTYLFGPRASLSYKIIYCVFVFLGSIITATNILEFSDLMILSMAFPNILGLVLLSGKVRVALDKYWAQYKAGEFKEFN
ncbi:alanine/glycine:cation symporter family protein [Planctomycetota bacterium]